MDGVDGRYGDRPSAEKDFADSPRLSGVKFPGGNPVSSRFSTPTGLGTLAGSNLVRLSRHMVFPPVSAGPAGSG